MKYLLSSFSVLILSASLACGYNGWGVYGSYWDTKGADSAGGGGVKVSVEMVPGVQLDLRGTYLEDFKVQGVNLEVLPLEAGLALALPVAEQAEILVGGGLGYYLMGGSANPDDEVGFYAATGLEWMIQPQASLFGELLYRIADANNVGPGGEAADLNGLGVNVGLMIRW